MEETLARLHLPLLKRASNGSRYKNVAQRISRSETRSSRRVGQLKINDFIKKKASDYFQVYVKF